MRRPPGRGVVAACVVARSDDDGRAASDSNVADANSDDDADADADDDDDDADDDDVDGCAWMRATGGGTVGGTVGATGGAAGGGDDECMGRAGAMTSTLINGTWDAFTILVVKATLKADHPPGPEWLEIGHAFTTTTVKALQNMLKTSNRQSDSQTRSRTQATRPSVY